MTPSEVTKAVERLDLFLENAVVYGDLHLHEEGCKDLSALITAYRDAETHLNLSEERIDEVEAQLAEALEAHRAYAATWEGRHAPQTDLADSLRLSHALVQAFDEGKAG